MILLIGSQFIYYGMKFNGSYHYGGPVWVIVNGVHSAIVYGAILAAACVTLLLLLQLVILFLPDDKLKQTMPDEDVQSSPLVLTPEQIEIQKLAYEQMQRDAQEFLAQEQKQIEAKKLLEEKQKQEAIRARRERSAKEAARAGLDSFL